MDECTLCGAPGAALLDEEGYPYCNEACRQADNPEDEE